MRPIYATVAVLALACGGSNAADGGTPGADGTPAVTAEADWVVLDGVQFPAAMAEAPDEVIEAYVFAAKHQDVLQYMPCYCGCENPRFAHDSNYDCFVDSIDRSGEVPRVDPDPMGFG